MEATGKTKATSGTPAFEVNRELALACELVQRDGVRRALTAARQLYPDLGIEIADIGGAVATYAGVNSPLSEAFGVGLEGDVTAADIVAITKFFSERGAVAKIQVGPLSPPYLGELLVECGYVPQKPVNMLVASVAELPTERNAHVAEARDVREWANASARAFNEGADVSEAFLAPALIMGATSTALEARVDEIIVASGCMDFDERHGIAALFAASTAVEFRRQGWQRALILDRIARAREAGMAYVRVEASPLSTSERNFRTLGFSVLYSRVDWRWRKPS